MPAPGKLAEVLTARTLGYLGTVPFSHGAGAPAAADAHDSADAVYLRTGTGSAATMLYVTANTGSTWRVVSVS